MYLAATHENYICCVHTLKGDEEWLINMHLCVCVCVFNIHVCVFVLFCFVLFVCKHKLRLWNSCFVKWLVDLNCVCEVLSEFITYFWVGI